MRVLIVESQPDLGMLWSRHLSRQGVDVSFARTQEEAVDLIGARRFDVIVLDLVLDHGSALAVADFAAFLWPETQVIFVTNTSFFSDGSIFQHCANARAFVQREVPPDDLVAMVDYYGATVSRAHAER